MDERRVGYLLAGLMMVPLYAFLGLCLWLGWGSVIKMLFR